MVDDGILVFLEDRLFESLWNLGIFGWRKVGGGRWVMDGGILVFLKLLEDQAYVIVICKKKRFPIENVRNSWKIWIWGLEGSGGRYFCYKLYEKSCLKAP